MKILIFLFALLPIAAKAQTVADYKHTMAKFQHFYNKGRGDSINAMFKHEPNEANVSEPMWSNKTVAEELQKSGTLQSFKFIGIDTVDPQRVYIFQTVFSKAGQKITSFTLDNNHQLRTFRFFTIPDGVDALL